VDLPEIRIETTEFPAFPYRCAVCGNEWEPGQTPVPSAYTVESIDAELPAPGRLRPLHRAALLETFAERVAQRQRFWES